MLIGLVFTLLLAGSILICFGSMKAKTMENKILFLQLPLIFYVFTVAFIVPIAARMAPVADDVSFATSLMVEIMILFFIFILICIITLPKLIEGFMTKHPYLIAASLLPVLWLVSYFTARFGFDMSTPVWYMMWAVFLFIMGKKAIRFIGGKGSKKMDKEVEKQREA